MKSAFSPSFLMLFTYILIDLCGVEMKASLLDQVGRFLTANGFNFITSERDGEAHSFLRETISTYVLPVLEKGGREGEGERSILHPALTGK